METGSFERFGKPFSARAGREWNFPSVPEPVVKVLIVSIAPTLPREDWGCQWGVGRFAIVPSDQ